MQELLVHVVWSGVAFEMHRRGIIEFAGQERNLFDNFSRQIVVQ